MKSMEKLLNSKEKVLGQLLVLEKDNHFMEKEVIHLFNIFS